MNVSHFASCTEIKMNTSQSRMNTMPPRSTASGDGRTARSSVATILLLAAILIVGCTPGTSEQGQSGELPGLPALQPSDDVEPDDCESPELIDLVEFAAQGHTWFHGEILDVYAVTDLGNTYPVLTSQTYEWDGTDLLIPLNECRSIRPRYRVRIRLLEAIGEELPEEIDAAVNDTHFSTTPTWNGPGLDGHDGFTWEGDRLAIGQHIGGHLAWSSRYEMAVLMANPGTPLFLVRDDQTIAFQDIEGQPRDFCYGVNARSILDELDGMHLADFMSLLTEQRGDGQAVVEEERLEYVRSRGNNSTRYFNDDIMAGVFYPFCTPRDAVYHGSIVR